MAKNIILCSDGTGNSGGKGNGTNVWRLFRAVDLQTFKAQPNAAEQIAFYDDGVGTDRIKLFKLLGGAFGYGLSRNVKQLYTRLVKNFEPGDHIYLFGFSRGAFTVRTLAGMITACGILDKTTCNSDHELQQCVDKAYKAYRRRYQAWLSKPWLKVEAWLRARRFESGDFRRTYGVQCSPDLYEGYENIDMESMTEERYVPIRFIGVWDTVDAVGFPIDEIATFWNKYIYCFKFPRQTLSPLINKACHALSIDDERHTFHPLMFDQSTESGERIEQVWFAGVHSNVGGGYPKQGMAHASLDWMINEAQANALLVNPNVTDALRADVNVHDKLYDSRAGLATYYRYRPRDIAQFCGKNGIERPAIHVGAFQRIALHTEDYAPGNIPTNFSIVADDPSNRGESNRELDNLASNIERSMAADGPLLRKHGPLVEARRVLHFWFFVATLAVLVIGVGLKVFFYREPPESGLILTPLKIVSGWIPVAGDKLFEWVIQPLFTYPFLGTLVILFPVVLYVVDIVLENRLKKWFSEFWWKTLSRPWW